MKRKHCLYLSVCCLSLAPALHAETSSGDKAAAEALFNDGVALVAAGSVAAGCGKFEASQTLDPTLGTTLRLADCYERAGKSASAWALFKQAEGLAHRHAESDRESLAHERAESLLTKLSYLTISLDSVAPAGLVVRRNGEPQPLPSLGVAIPVDPGPQEISATAPSYQGWSGHVEIQAGPGSVSVSVPALQPARLSAAASTPHAASASAQAGEPGKTQRSVGLAATLTGVAALLTGTGLAWYANHENDRSQLDQYCPLNNHNGCTEAGVTIRQRAESFARASTAVFIGGAAVLGAGIVLWSTAPTQHNESASAAKWRLSAVAAPGSIQAALGGTW
ncbi:MAG TPA: hypothetical protein VGF76_10145 [Polyangiaceae bacterium]